MSKRTVRTKLRITGERRDPTAATVQLQYSGLGVPQTNRHNAQRATARALTAWVVMRCIQIKAQDLAGIPFVAGPRVPVSYTELPETNPNARLARLVGQVPAPKTSAQVWWEWMLTQRYITGQFASEIDWGTGGPKGGQVAALWPLTASALKAVPTDGGTEWWKRFEYGRPDKPRTLSPDRVFYGWDPAPDDFRQPWSILAAAQLDVDVAVQVARYNAAFLRNDARPAAVVVTEAFATEEDFDQFVNQFEGRHQGVDNAGRLAFVEADPDGATPGQAINIQTLGISQKDARMLEMHRQSLEHVAMALGVPWSRLSAADRTFSNAGQESVDYWKGLASDARKFGAEVNASLAPLLGPEVGWFDLSGVEALAPRPPVSAQEAVALVNGFIATPEEVRPWYGLAGPGPDMPALPEAPTPPAVDPAHAPMAELPAARTVTTQTVLDGLRLAERVAETRVVTASELKAARLTEWRSFDSDMANLEESWTEEWQDYFARQAAIVVRQITEKRVAFRLTAASEARELRADVNLGGPFDADEIAKWTTQAAKIARRMDQQAVTTSIARINSKFGVSFDIKAPFIDDFINTRANQLAGTVSDTTYAAIQQALTDGVADGASIDDLAAAVRDVFADASANRAKTIARTEVIGAANGSHTLASQNLPSDVAAGRLWISTPDERTRDSHADADGQVVGMYDAFDVGGEPLMYPGDPNASGDEVINCRCTTATLTPKEFADYRSRQASEVPLGLSRAAVRMVDRGPFDPEKFRSALLAVA